MILLQLGLKDEKLWFVKTKVQCETKQLPQKQKTKTEKQSMSKYDSEPSTLYVPMTK
jgi:hypothetical protein